MLRVEQREHMKEIDLIVGARPNFMKVASIINAIQSKKDSELAFRLIHTGQHYDSNLSGSFFDQLGIPQPHANLEVGSGTQAKQTAAIMLRYEELLAEKSSDACLVVGDVNSTMACAITAQKLGVPVAHVEAGIRSNDWSMPEEINRLVTDSITNWFFTTSKEASDNLLRSGICQERIFFVGNTMIDTLLSNIARLKAPHFWQSLKLSTSEYFVLTLHRPSNVDNRDGLANLLRVVAEEVRGLPVIFPAHPRTAKILSEMDATADNIHLVDPLPYLEFNFLVKSAKAIITDSGGITEETTVLGVPCMTLRDNTERPETISIGTNELLGTDPRGLKPAMDCLFAGNWKKGSIPEKWDGKSAERIIAHMEKILGA